MFRNQKRFTKAPPEPGYISRSVIEQKYGFSKGSLARYEKESYYIKDLDAFVPQLKRKDFDKDRNVYYPESQIKELVRLRELLYKKSNRI